MCVCVCECDVLSPLPSGGSLFVLPRVGSGVLSTKLDETHQGGLIPREGVEVAAAQLLEVTRLDGRYVSEGGFLKVMG